MRVDVYAIDKSDDYLILIGRDSYRMDKNADHPLDAGHCVYLAPDSMSARWNQGLSPVTSVPIGIVKQIAYILRRDTAIRVTKALEELTEFLDDDGLRSNLKG